MISQIFFCLLAFGVINAIRINESGVIRSVDVGAQPGVPGGKWEVNLTKLNDYEEVARLALVALMDMDAKSPDPAEHFLIHVKQAARAVVAGMMHEIVFTFGECVPGTRNITNEPLAIAREPNEKGVDHARTVRKVCQEKPDGKYGICWAEVFEQPWTNTTQLFEERHPYVCHNLSKENAAAEY